MDPNTPIGNTTLAKIEKASIKKAILEVAGRRPELVPDVIIGVLEFARDNPHLAIRAYPFIALMAAYTDGKPVDAGTHQEMSTRNPLDLSSLSQSELRDRAQRLVRLLGPAPSEEVIDAEVVPNPEDMSLEQLQEEARRAQADVERANEEVRRARIAVDKANEELARIRGTK